MLNVLDEKWKDHLYDLDQLRNAIHYRSWGQKDPLIEYKQEAYTMFVDLMNDIYNTFTRAIPQGAAWCSSRRRRLRRRRRRKPTKRYNALGILEDIPVDERPSRRPAQRHRCGGRHRTGRARRRQQPVTARKDPIVVGAGRTRSLEQQSGAAANIDWSTVGRNDPCPCGSGKKFKKCHGARRASSLGRPKDLALPRASARSSDGE